MHSGFFSINQGETCSISYLNESMDAAQKNIPNLKITKVISLPATLMDIANDPSEICWMDEVLVWLNPDNSEAATPEPAPLANTA